MDIEPINVLLIEDNVGDCELILKMLDASEIAEFQLTHTSRLTSGLKLLESEKFDIILLDLGLPDSVGFESFR
jgi:DNA-binding response OmpR family regulator